MNNFLIRKFLISEQEQISNQNKKIYSLQKCKSEQKPKLKRKWKTERTEKLS
jgi:hypothetical protein